MDHPFEYIVGPWEAKETERGIEINGPDHFIPTTIDNDGAGVEETQRQAKKLIDLLVENW